MTPGRHGWESSLAPAKGNAGNADEIWNGAKGRRRKALSSGEGENGTWLEFGIKRNW